MRLGVASTFPPYRGGIAQFNAAMTRALEAEGHHVETLTWSRQYPNWLFPGTSQWEPNKSPTDATMPAILDSMSQKSWAIAGGRPWEKTQTSSSSRFGTRPALL